MWGFAGVPYWCRVCISIGEYGPSYLRIPAELSSCCAFGLVVDFEKLFDGERDVGFDVSLGTARVLGGRIRMEDLYEAYINNDL